MHAVAAAADRHLEPGLAGETERRHHVGDAVALRDYSWAAVVQSLEVVTSGVVAGAARREHLATEVAL